jgi:hypothetical protein
MLVCLRVDFLNMAQVAWFELKQRLEFLIQRKPRLYFFNSVLIQGKGTIEVQKWL